MTGHGFGRSAGALTGTLALALSALAICGAAAAGAHTERKPRVVRRVGSPPATISPGERVRVTFKAPAKPAFFVSHQTRPGRGDVRVRARVRRHRGAGTATLTLPRRLAPGAWFVLACTSRGRCAASATPGVVHPTHLGTPVDASVGLASADAATATIGPAGGTLRATGPGGTGYLLTIPSGSVAQSTAITMTPLQSLTGAPFAGKLAAGVQFAPEGLLLFHGASLIITLAHKVPAGRRIGLGFSAGGAGLHVVPLVPSTKRIEIPVAHFSGVALGDAPGGADGATGGDGAQGDSDNTGFYGQMLGGLVGSWGDGSMSQDQFESAALSVLKDWYRDIVSDEIPPGLNDDGAAQTAIQDLLTWARTGALTIGDGHTCSGGDAGYFCTYDGMSKEFGTDWQDSLVGQPVLKLLAGIYNRAQQRCADNHDLTEIPKILDAYRNLVFSGHPDNVSIDQLLACEHFTVAFDSTIINKHGGDDITGSDTNEYQANIKIKPDVAQPDAPLTGTAAGSYIQAAGQEIQHDQACGSGSGGTYDEITDELSGTGDTATVSAFTLPTDTGGPPVLKLSLGSPTEQYRGHIDTTACATSRTFTQSLWAGDFLDLHKSQIDFTVVPTSDFGFAYSFVLNEGSGAVVATASYNTPSLAFGEDTLTEHTTITVTHTPQPFTKL